MFSNLLIINYGVLSPTQPPILCGVSGTRLLEKLVTVESSVDKSLFTIPKVCAASVS